MAALLVDDSGSSEHKAGDTASTPAPCTSSSIQGRVASESCTYIADCGGKDCSTNEPFKGNNHDLVEAKGDAEDHKITASSSTSTLLRQISSSSSSAPPRPVDKFLTTVPGHWLDSMGNSIIVSQCPKKDEELTAVLTPLIDHPQARDRVLALRRENKTWHCGAAKLELFDDAKQRLVWTTADGRRSVWSRTAGANGAFDARRSHSPSAKRPTAFPWLVNSATPEPWLPLDVPRDILYDGARVAALLDIRQLIGAYPESQEKLTCILMDHDLSPCRGDYLIPGLDSPLWESLPVSPSVLSNVRKRISRIPHEAISQRVSWSGPLEVAVGRHKIAVRKRDVMTLEARWGLSPADPHKKLEIGRLLALYSVFDNPMSHRRSGMHLGIDPELRRRCDFELFASPLNATVSNGRYASKWPHVEWRFGSIGSYPSVLQNLPANSIVCINPPFTDAYLEDVMRRVPDMKKRFRVRIAMPILEKSWRNKLMSELPSARLLKTFYDASEDQSLDILHPTLLWEDPRCAEKQAADAESEKAELTTPSKVDSESGSPDDQDPTERQATASQTSDPSSTGASTRKDTDGAQSVRQSPNLAPSATPTLQGLPLLWWTQSGWVMQGRWPDGVALQKKAVDKSCVEKDTTKKREELDSLSPSKEADTPDKPPPAVAAAERDREALESKQINEGDAPLPLDRQEWPELLSSKSATAQKRTGQR
eukprot:TRINITY_DN10465_c0_g1_i9.p1 TRINITY_DN10465_c0_g1~~TRINITY_DN10465_c0_g1_i9.p1  ORF type:complete len:708 (+),score=61.71 TRINITY_DN10465_c0_g1_i9:266-2389(+)